MMAAAALALLAAFLLAPGAAWGQQNYECQASGQPNDAGAITCADQAWANSISHLISTTATSLSLTVGGGTATTVTAAGASAGISLDANSSSAVGDLTLTVGSAGAVVVQEESGGSPTASHGIAVRQRGSGTTTVDVRNTVTIGTMAARMGRTGIQASGESSAGAATVMNAAAIYSTGAGIEVSHSGAGATTVTNHGTIDARGATDASDHGIHVQTSGSVLAGAVSVTNTAPIFAEQQGIRVHRSGAGTNAATTVTNSGAISAGVGNAGDVNFWDDQPNGITVRYGPGTAGPAKIVNTGAVTVSGDYAGIAMNYAGVGAVEIDNEGDIAAAMGRGIQLLANRAGGVTVTNSGAVDAANLGLDLSLWSGSGAVTLTNRGRVTVTTEAALAGNALRLSSSASGAITISNSGVLRSKNHAIFATMPAANAGAITLTNEADVTSENGDGIRIERGDAGDVALRNGADVSGRNHGVHVAEAGRIEIAQEAGTISGRVGVYAEVSRASATGDARSTDGDGNHLPAIDVLWTGGSTARGTAESDRGRFTANRGLRLPSLDQETSAVKAVAGSARWGSAAGIEAHALSWRDVMTEVARGDAPAAFFTNNGQQTAAVPTGATAADNAYVAQFRAALGNDDVDVSEILTAIGSTATTAAADLTDAQIVAYLQADDPITRIMLWNILARGLSDGEKAVLRAVAAGDGAGLDAALTAAGFTDDPDNDEDYWSKVKALLDRYNLDDIRVRMTGGSIDSRGDGIRAYYATPHDRNGAIDVTVAEGATVTGGVAGIRVANAGLDAGEDGTAGTDDDILKQSVTVHGMVTGGTDAAVHLVGGGRLTVGETGKVYAGSSGRAIRVNDPGRAVIRIDGVVRGGAGAPAAVDLSGGGSVTVGMTGRVMANGADAGIYVANAGLGAVNKDSEWTRFLRLENDAENVRQHFVTVNGMATGGTDAGVHLAGGGMLLVGETGEVRAGASGVGVLVNDPGDAYVTIHGLVQGGEGGAAAVHLTGGGGVAVGPTGRVEANGAAAAIRTDEADTPVIVYVAGDEDVEGAVSREAFQSLAERVTGRLPAQTRLGVTDAAGPTGGVTDLPRNDGGGVGDPANFPWTPCPTEGHTRDDDGMCRAPMMGFDCDEAAKVNDRCRLYEALPSVLLAMNGLPTYEERTSAARDARGGWARVEAARGKWKADTSTRENVAYDHRRSGVRAGADFAMGDAGRVGVSIHGLEGSAEMAGVGEVDLSGSGLGVHGTAAFAGGFYLDAQAAATWYEADLKSAVPVRGPLKNDANGRGYALGVEVGKRLPAMDGGVTLTPRAGLRWSKVRLYDFDEEVVGGARVSVEDAQSLKGRAGVGVEKALDGAGMDGSRLFGSLDVEQEFREETEVDVSGTSLKASAKKTRFRLAAGAVRVWGEGRYVLQGSVGYAAGGGGNRDYGGGLSFAMRF